MQALLVDDRGDAEARPLDEIALDRVGGAATSIGRRFVEPARRVIWPIPSGASAATPLAVEAVVADELERPDAPELGDLLGPGHPAEEVCRRARRPARPGSR